MNIRGKKRILWTILSLIPLLALASCGGGAPGPAAGSGGTGIGPVSGFGSVIVNGVKFATGNANIVIDGVENRPESDLKVGMRVRAEGVFSTTDNSGSATRIEAIREVLGPMDDDGVDNVLNRLRVAGQTVLVNPATLFDNVVDLLALQAIQSGTLRHPEVEVHGAADDAGFIHATYIRKGADDFRLTDNMKVRGKISGLALITTRFFINSLLVNYGGAVKVNVPLTGLANGMYVEVKGILNVVVGSGTLNASRIAVLDNTVGASNDAVRVEGYVVSGSSKSSFVLLGPGGKISVDGQAATLIPSTGSITPGQEVQVEGTVTGTVLKASVIRVQPLNNVRIEAAVSGSPNLAAGTFAVLLNRPVQVDGLTRYNDDVGGDRTFGLANLNPNDNVEVVGSNDGNKITAVLVERIQPSDPGKVLLQGPIDNGSIVDQVSFGIVGATVTSNVSFGNTEFKDASGNPVSMPTFFATVLPSLQPDQVVKVKRGVFIPVDPPRIRDDDATSKMEIGIERVNN